MGGRLAIIACGGELPVQIAKAYEDALILTLAGVPNNFGKKINERSLENLGGIFADLKAASVTDVVFAGALVRPVLERGKFDPIMRQYAPGIEAAMHLGDDALLRQVVEIFEEQGFEVVGAAELLPGLMAQVDLHVGPPLGARHLADIERARDILLALSPLDVGQGCVVEKGQCLGIETLQGTDFLLKAVADTTRPVGGGVFLKAAKRGQDLRIDMPAIGPVTIAAVAKAGLAGLVIEAEKVMILEREKTLQTVEKAGIFLTAWAL